MNKADIDQKGLGIGILVIIGIGFVGFLIANFWSMPLADTLFVKSDCNDQQQLSGFYGNTTQQKIATCTMWNHVVDTNYPLFKWGGFIIFTFGIPLAIGQVLFRGMKIHRTYEWILAHDTFVPESKDKPKSPFGTMPKGYGEQQKKRKVNHEF